MNEFSIIKDYFQKHVISRSEIKFGIGDDCACLKIPATQDLLVSVDTLVSGVHFSPSLDPYDIAYKAVMVNVSDCVAMAAEPFAVLLSLTMPDLNVTWLDRFAMGLKEALGKYNIALAGGDLTRGPLSITITIHATAPCDRAVFRHGARENDIICVSGCLGLAAYAVDNLDKAKFENWQEWSLLHKALNNPTPRVDFIYLLRTYASSAIDVSDGFVADLNHICEASKLGALLDLKSIPIDPVLVNLTQEQKALSCALYGGDDYEICFTVPEEKYADFLIETKEAKLKFYKVGVMQKKTGIFILNENKQYVQLKVDGYMHFKGDYYEQG